MAFTDELHTDPLAIWDAILKHPMIQGISDGSLDETRFQYWLQQDYLYLIDYARLLAYGTAKAPTLEYMTAWASLLDSTINSEIPHHRNLAEEFHLSPEELENSDPSPVTQAYTDFLIRTAATGTFGDIVATLLPCLWGFNKIGTRLAETGLPDHDGYAAWIEVYSSESFTSLTEWCKDLMNNVARDASVHTRTRYRELFLTSVRYEYRFWEAAWQQEQSPSAP